MSSCLLNQGWSQLFEIHAFPVVAVVGQGYAVVIAVAVVAALNSTFAVEQAVVPG